MVVLDEAVLTDPGRLRAVDRALLSLPGRSTPLDDTARLVTRLLHTPMACVCLITEDEELFVGEYAIPHELSLPRRAPLAYSVCKYAVSADGVILSRDMTAEPDEILSRHLLVVEFGIRAFLGVPVRDRDGRPIGSLAVLDRRPRDWTGEETEILTAVADTIRVQDDSAFHATLLESMEAGVVACDRSGRIVYANRSVREVIGFGPDGPLAPEFEAEAYRLLATTDQRSMPPGESPLIRALNGECVVSEDVLIRRPGHRTRIFDTCAQPILGPTGDALGAVAVAHEVTALRRVERFRNCHIAVQHVLQSAGTVAEATPEVLRAVTATLGWPAAELYLIDEATGLLQAAGHWDFSGVEPDGFFGHTPIRGQGITGRAWETGRPIWVPDLSSSPDLRTAHERERVEICLRRGVRTALAVPVRDGGTLLGVLTCYAGTQEYEPDLLTVLLDGVAAQVGVFVAQRRAEELSRQLARAQADFVDLVGHELRTPLTSITANAALLAEETSGLDAESRHMVETVARNAAVLQRIADTLLDLAGLDAGHLELDVAEVDLVALLCDAVTEVRRTADRLTLVIELPAELHLPGDAERLRQVVDDLLLNAVRYSPPGEPVHVTLCTDDTMADLCIADHGIGTPPGEHDRVFDRFFRGSNVRHQGTPGSGLGLSLARAIVLLHGGTIRLSDNRPSGTVVSVRLPLAGPPGA
ncbi:GAF domain-containing protein [Actinoplanes flavus]|uniref:Sensor-like histidine kinase SenX3 n=1 Tax=Actinoplanes flavus TaxID=2820290 RepID=A0ABS3UK18_9ACTN|nr:GAF domain-containing protein [Actinoplanes flavus]MBO3738047.1 GAF domain-containing protein [Actinoplanes flavus]